MALFKILVIRVNRKPRRILYTTSLRPTGILIQEAHRCRLETSDLASPQRVILLVTAVTLLLSDQVLLRVLSCFLLLLHLDTYSTLEERLYILTRCQGRGLGIR